jgi:hypothetical protein
VGHWYECEVRACAQGHGLANCAHCPDYSCKTLEGFLAYVPEARARLDSIRLQSVA